MMRNKSFLGTRETRSTTRKAGRLTVAETSCDLTAFSTAIENGLLGSNKADQLYETNPLLFFVVTYARLLRVFFFAV